MFAGYPEYVARVYHAIRSLIQMRRRVVLREEIVTGMQLLGVTSIEQLTPDLVRYVDRLKPMARSRL